MTKSIPTNAAPDALGPTVTRVGAFVMRYALVVILLWIGLLKFTAYEAEGIKPLVSNSPLMSWGYQVASVRGWAMLIGVIEIVVALLIASRPFSPRACALGSLGAIIMFLTTLSFLVTTPPAWQEGYGFPFLSPMPGQFIVKDLISIGVAVWSLGEAWTAATVLPPTRLTRVEAVGRP